MDTIYNRKVLGVFTLAMMSVAAIINLRGLPMMASVGLNAIFFYLLAALFFLIPSSLVSAELASAFPQAGGVYLWVRKAFGDKMGFLTIWLEWFNNVISFPASLSFMSATLAYIFAPSLALNKNYLFCCTLIILWSATLFNILGIKASSRLNVIGALCGTLIPGLIIIMLGFFWLISGKASQIQFNLKDILPNFNFSHLAFFAGVMSGYSGMQLIAFHAQNVKHPQRDFIKAIMIAVVLIILITIFSSLAIAVVVPNKQLSLVSGLIQGFAGFFQAFHISWALPILALLIVIGGFSSLSAWLMGPARGLCAAAQNKHFPEIFGYENQHGAPVRILILQAIIASMLASIFLLMPNSSSAFWVLLDLSSQSTLLMYIFVFSAAIALRYKEKFTHRSFRVAGRNFGMWLIAGMGIMACLIALLVSFTPPASLETGSFWHYEAILIGSNIIHLSVPFIIIWLVHKKS